MSVRRSSTSVWPGGAVTLLAIALAYGENSTTASKSARAPQPAATLKPDALDEPAATSVNDALRAAALAAGGHTMPHGTYTHRDAGRTGVMPTRAPGPPPNPSPAADPHHMHRSMPSPKPSPSPRHEESRP
jgi:hypothetical protein